MNVPTRLALVALCLVAAGCHGIAPNPTSPTPSPAQAVTPTAIRLVVLAGELPIGGGSTELLIETVGGTSVAPNVTVRLSVDGGELEASEVTTDHTGHARTRWTGTKPATLTGASGALTASTVIAVKQPVVLPPDPPPPPRPTPPPPPPPLPPAPPGLSVTVSANPQQVLMGQPTTLTAQVSNLQAGETVLAYQWDWEGGTPFTADETTAGNSRQHSYATDGVKTPVVQVQTSLGRTASANTRVYVVRP